MYESQLIKNGTFVSSEQNQLYDSYLDKTGTIKFPTTYIDEVPYPVRNNGCVVYNNKIHIIGGIASSGNEKKHYSWSEEDGWIQESTLPYKFASSPNVIVYDNKIHILGNGNTGEGYGDNPYYAHFAWDGTTWESVSTLPIIFQGDGRCVIYNNKIHILKNQNHYSWDGVSWKQESTIPIYCSYSSVYVFDDKIYLYGGNTNTNSSYCTWDGTNWSSVSKSGTCIYATPIVYNGIVYLISYCKSSSYSNEYLALNASNLQNSGSNPRNLPYNNVQLALVVFYKNEIHILGGGYSETNKKKHYHLINIENNEWSNEYYHCNMYYKSRKIST